MNKVVLLVPHYNNLLGLKKSIASIGKNEKLDILVIDDGSKSKIDEGIIKKSYLGKGDVYFKYLKVNNGIEKALNCGLKVILTKKYTYTARLDCGDICAPNRFEKQQHFLETNKNIYLVGSFVRFVDIRGKLIYNLELPIEDKTIRNKMYINAMHIHPSIMFKNEILSKVGLYPTKHKAAEDYAFFFKVLKKYKVANLKDYLVTCEVHSDSISSINRKLQVRNRIKIILENFYFGFYPIYGLLRNCIIYILPLKFLLGVKRVIK